MSFLSSVSSAAGSKDGLFKPINAHWLLSQAQLKSYLTVLLFHYLSLSFINNLYILVAFVLDSRPAVLWYIIWGVPTVPITI